MINMKIYRKYNCLVIPMYHKPALKLGRKKGYTFVGFSIYHTYVHVCITMDLETYFISVEAKIMTKTANLEDKKGCKVEEGCIKAYGYGVTKVKFPDGKGKVKGIHVKHCVKIDHLVADPHYINLSRLPTKNLGWCLKTHH